MSRYTFHPKLETRGGRNRRLLLGVIALGAFATLSLALLGFGICLLTGGCSLGARAPQAEPTPFVPLVTIYAPQPTIAPPSAAQPSATGVPPAADNPAAAQPATMNPRGRIEGIPDFVCPNPRPAPAGFGYGIQSNWPVGDIGLFNSIMAEQLKMDWTKAQVRWADFEPDGRGQYALYKWQLLDAFTADANKKGLHILFSVLDAPAWSRPQNAFPGRPDLLGPPDNYEDARLFIEKLLARYKGCVQAIEVWNEMNLDREWTVASRQINARDYVAFLDAVVPTIRQIDPTVIVVMGALSPTGANITEGGVTKVVDDLTYMDQFVAAGGPSRVDCIGVHLNGYNMPPDKEWNEGYNDPTAKFRGPFDSPHPSWSFKSTMRLYYEKTRKPLCVTEFGWASMENLKRSDGTPVQGAPPGFDFALDNTEQEQAEWIVRGFQIMRESGYVKFAIVFNLDYIQKVGGEPDQENVATYSITRRDGSPRPAFEALKQMPRPR